MYYVYDNLTEIIRIYIENDKHMLLLSFDQP